MNIFQYLKNNVKFNYFSCFYSVDCARFVCKYIDFIAFVVPPSIDSISNTAVKKLRSEIAYMLLAYKSKSCDEETELIRKVQFDE